MKKAIVSAIALLLTLSVFAQPAYFNTEEEMFEQADLPAGEIKINNLKWLPGSHEFWVNENGNIYVYTADKLNDGKLVLSDDQVKAAGLSTTIEAIVWSADRKKILAYTKNFLAFEILTSKFPQKFQHLNQTIKTLTTSLIATRKNQLPQPKPFFSANRNNNNSQLFSLLSNSPIHCA